MRHCHNIGLIHKFEMIHTNWMKYNCFLVTLERNQEIKYRKIKKICMYGTVSSGV